MSMPWGLPIFIEHKYLRFSGSYTMYTDLRTGQYLCTLQICWMWFPSFQYSTDTLTSALEDVRILFNDSTACVCIERFPPYKSDKVLDIIFGWLLFECIILLLNLILIFLLFSWFGWWILLFYIFTTTKDQSSNPACSTPKFCSMDIVKLDAVQLYKC